MQAAACAACGPPAWYAIQNFLLQTLDLPLSVASFILLLDHTAKRWKVRLHEKGKVRRWCGSVERVDQTWWDGVHGDMATMHTSNNATFPTDISQVQLPVTHLLAKPSTRTWFSRWSITRLRASTHVPWWCAQETPVLINIIYSLRALDLLDERHAGLLKKSLEGV